MPIKTYSLALGETIWNYIWTRLFISRLSSSDKHL